MTADTNDAATTVTRNSFASLKLEIIQLPY